MRGRQRNPEGNPRRTPLHTQPRISRGQYRRRGEWDYPGREDNPGFRRQRLVEARQAKRSRIVRFILIVGVMVAAVAFVAVYFVVRTGSSGGQTAASEPAIVDDPGSGNVMFLAKDESGRLTQVLVLAGTGQGYGLMVLPGRTVVQTPAAGFQRLDRVQEAGGQPQMDQAVANLLQIPIRYHVSLSYEALATLLEQAGALNLKTGKTLTLGQGAGTAPITLGSGDNPMNPGQAAAVLKAAAGDSRDGPQSAAVFYQALHDALAAKPEADRKRVAADLTARIQTDMSGGDFNELVLAVLAPGRGFAVSPLPVRATGAGDGWYFEPALDQLGAVTGGAGQGAPVELEIRNGTEIAGLAEAAGTRLQPLGLSSTVSPETSSVNYDTTQIRCGSEAVLAGYQVQEALGAGEVIKDDSMEKRQIIAIIGRDMSVALTGQQQ